MIHWTFTTIQISGLWMVQSPTTANWLAILALGVIWGGTFMVVSIALEGYGPLTVACARTTLGAFGLCVLMIIMGSKFPTMDRRMLSILIPAGVLSTAVPFGLLSWGQQYVPSAFAGLSMAALPLFVLPLAHFFTDERLQSRQLIGVCIGFLGALALIGPGVARLGTGLEPLGQLACLAAALCYAISSILTRKCPPIDPIAFAASGLLIGTVLLFPAMLLVEGVPTWQGTRPSLAIIFLGFFPTALAAILRVWVIRTAGSVFMTLVNYQVPVWSMLFGAWVLSEVLPLRFFAALTLIILGLAISQWPSLKRMFA